MLENIKASPKIIIPVLIVLVLIMIYIYRSGKLSQPAAFTNNKRTKQVTFNLDNDTVGIIRNIYSAQNRNLNLDMKSPV